MLITWLLYKWIGSATSAKFKESSKVSVNFLDKAFSDSSLNVVKWEFKNLGY